MVRYGLLLAGWLALSMVAQARAEKQGHGPGPGKNGPPGQQVGGPGSSGGKHEEMAAKIRRALEAKGIAPGSPQAAAIKAQIQQATASGMQGPQLAAFVKQCLQGNGQGNGPGNGGGPGVGGNGPGHSGPGGPNDGPHPKKHRD